MPEQRLDRVIRNAEYLKTFKISRSTRDRLENQGILPKRFKLNPSGKAVGWWESELIDAQERMKRKNADVLNAQPRDNGQFARKDAASK